MGLEENRHNDYKLEEQIKIPINIFEPHINKIVEQLIADISKQVKSNSFTYLTQALLHISSLLKNLPCILFKYQNNSTDKLDYISENCWKLTGYSAQDFYQNEQINFNNLIYSSDRNLRKKAIQKAIATQSNYQIEYQIKNSAGETKWLWELGEIFNHTKQNIPITIGIIIDITAKKRIEQEKSLLLNISEAIRLSTNVETALSYTIQSVCEITQWDFGEAWIPSPDKKSLIYATSWFPLDKNQVEGYSLSLAKFREESYNFTFQNAMGLPGKIWASKQTEWMENIHLNQEFWRSPLAHQCGLKSGFGVPIIANNEVVAILIFFLRQSISIDFSLLSLVESVACQLGNIFKHKQIELELQETQKQLNTLIHSVSSLFFRISYSENWGEDYISHRCQNLTGYSPHELIEDNKLDLAKITHPLDLEKVISNLEFSLKNHQNYCLEYRIFTKNNQEKWILEKGEGIYNQDGNILGIEGFMTDISHLKETEETVLEAQIKYRHIFDNSIEGIFQTTANGYYLCINQSLAKIYGYETPQQLQISLNEAENALYVKKYRRKEFLSLLAQKDILTNFESQVYRQDGSIIWICENATAVRDYQGILLYYEGTVEDITKYKEAQAKLHQASFVDYLTQLPNRNFFLTKLDKLITNVKQNQSDNHQFGLLFLNCNRFKIVNDSLGHHIGDLLLIDIAQRLKSCLQENDLIARFGADEFTILIPLIQSVEQLIQLAQQLNDTFKSPFLIEKHQLFSSISIGIFFSGNLTKNELNKVTPLEVIQYADRAMYEAKSNAKVCYQIFQSQMYLNTLNKLSLENDLRKATIDKTEFSPYYQPIFDLNTKQIKGFESLIRWQHPQKGIVSPAEFIPLAEETSLIIPIGFWMLKQVCLQWVKWQKTLTPSSQTIPFISVNLSCQEFNCDDFLPQLDLILDETKVNASFIKLEITESCCILTNKSTITKLKEIGDRQIKLWIDDFGTGYSSLSYLQDLPINGLKLDQSFIRDIDKNITKSKIVAAVINLAQDLDLEVVAEGIETVSQSETLGQLGCKLGQGYHFSKPMNLSETNKFLLNN